MFPDTDTNTADISRVSTVERVLPFDLERALKPASPDSGAGELGSWALPVSQKTEASRGDEQGVSFFFRFALFALIGVLAAQVVRNGFGTESVLPPPDSGQLNRFYLPSQGGESLVSESDAVLLQEAPAESQSVDPAISRQLRLMMEKQNLPTTIRRKFQVSGVNDGQARTARQSENQQPRIR